MRGWFDSARRRLHSPPRQQLSRRSRRRVRSAAHRSPVRAPPRRSRRRDGRIRPARRPTVVEVRTINDGDPALAAQRPEFNSLPASYPERKLFMETGRPAKGGPELTRRAIDLIAPIGYGQRALIVAPAAPARRRCCTRSPRASRSTIPTRCCSSCSSTNDRRK